MSLPSLAHSGLVFGMCIVLFLIFHLFITICILAVCQGSQNMDLGGDFMKYSGRMKGERKQDQKIYRCDTDAVDFQIQEVFSKGVLKGVFKRYSQMMFSNDVFK